MVTRLTDLPARPIITFTTLTPIPENSTIVLTFPNMTVFDHQLNYSTLSHPVLTHNSTMRTITITSFSFIIPNTTITLGFGGQSVMNPIFRTNSLWLSIYIEHDSFLPIGLFEGELPVTIEGLFFLSTHVLTKYNCTSSRLL